MMAAKPVPTCQERLASRGRFDFGSDRRCGKPVVQDGLCKLHLSINKRREADSEKYDAEVRATDELRASLKARIVALDLTDVAELYYDRQRKLTESVVVPIEVLEKLTKSSVRTKKAEPNAHFKVINLDPHTGRMQCQWTSGPLKGKRFTQSAKIV